MRVALIAGVLLATTSAVAANPSQEVDVARSLYSRGEYQKTVDTIAPVINQIKDEKELVEAHYLLAVSYHFLRDPKRARAEFIAILSLDPDYRLDPVVEDPAVYATFEGVRKELRDDLEEIRRKRADEERKKRQPQVQTVITVNNTSTLFNWVPFGAPQLANGRTAWGTFFLTTQSVLLTTSIGAFAYQIYRWDPPTRPPASEVDDVQRLQTIQIGAGALFFLAYGWGVLDAYRNQPPPRTIRQVPATEKVTLVPWLDPETAGLGARWEF